MEGMDHGAPQGLAVSADGYTLVPSNITLAPGTTAPFAFKVIGKDGKPVKAYTLLHEKELHFIVVRRDMTGYQHLHPARAASGTWSVPLAVAAAGVYKAFANFQPAGQAMPMPVTLAIDLMASGQFLAAPLPAPTTTTTVDGLTVDMAGQVTVGGSELTFAVTRSGTPVELQPYLGAKGHLVALRAGDLAYLHVHPEDMPPDGHAPVANRVTFLAPVPTAGQYRLFLDFKTAGVVRTAEFTVIAGPAAAGSHPGHISG